MSTVHRGHVDIMEKEIDLDKEKEKKKTDATMWGQVVLNALVIIISVILFVSHFNDTVPIYRVSGIVMVVSGINEVILVLRCYGEKKRAEKLAQEAQVARV